MIRKYTSEDKFVTRKDNYKDKNSIGKENDKNKVIKDNNADKVKMRKVKK